MNQSHIQNFQIDALPRAARQSSWLEVATRADGGATRLPLLTVTGAQTGPTLVVTAGVHGDEYEGIEAISKLYQQIQSQDLRGTLVMVPVCNVPAYEAGLRASPIDGLNLARVFPGDQTGTLTQRIAYWMREKLLRPADFYIDLHSGGVAGNIPTMVGYTYADNETGHRSRAAAYAFGAPVVWGHPPPIPPGRTISAATELGVPSLYTEAPGGGYARPDYVACFSQGVRNVMVHLSMMDEQPQPRALTHDLMGDGNMDSVISAPEAGFFRATVELLDEVDAGQKLGAIHDFSGAVLAEIVADRPGVVIMLRRVHRVHVGDGLAHITHYAKPEGN